MKNYKILLHKQTNVMISEYLSALHKGQKAGRYLQEKLDSLNLLELQPSTLLEKLINTKRPQIFAESAVYGDGSDWTPTELKILGDISIAVPVMIFDTGHHTAPEVYKTPWQGTLLFTPGALLRNGKGCIPADWPEVTKDEKFRATQYFRLYERRLLPVFQYANNKAAESNLHALITIPGLGCGQFAGPFRGQLGRQLRSALALILEKHGSRFSNIRAVYYDPYNECEEKRYQINGTSLIICPLRKSEKGKSQLCRPEMYEREYDNFKDCQFFSVVAWDHVSWPGNDSYIGNRATDDGVKAAATSTMTTLSGIEGSYNIPQKAYIPPHGYNTWLDVVTQESIQLTIDNNVIIYP